MPAARALSAYAGVLRCGTAVRQTRVLLQIRAPAQSVGGYDLEEYPLGNLARANIGNKILFAARTTRRVFVRRGTCEKSI